MRFYGRIRWRVIHHHLRELFTHIIDIFALRTCGPWGYRSSKILGMVRRCDPKSAFYLPIALCACKFPEENNASGWHVSVHSPPPCHFCRSFSRCERCRHVLNTGWGETSEADDNAEPKSSKQQPNLPPVHICLHINSPEWVVQWWFHPRHMCI